MGWSKLVDLALPSNDDGPRPFDMPAPTGPRYPYGARITLDDHILTKMDLDCDCDVGDVIDLRAFATVVRVEKEAGMRSVTLQIERLAVESEMDKEDGE